MLNHKDQRLVRRHSQFLDEIIIKMKRKNKACRYFPCHKELEDCTFCYCPFYPCENKERGHFINDGEIWDCSECNWIHKKETVDKIFEVIRNTEIF